MTGPNAATITLRETMDLLDGAFAETLEGVASDRYGIWLGSGISFGRMPKLADVIESALDHLQTRIDPANPGCPYRESLTAILDLSSLSDDEKATTPFDQPVASWPQRDKLRDSLPLNYARVLDVAPNTEDADYLLWDAVDVRGQFADPTRIPDAEHVAIAALVLEGTASELASANWDGLIEKAVEEFGGGADLLQVVVLPEDVRTPRIRARLYKFHGCALLAAADEARYRPRLVGRQSQINSWAAKSENAVIAGKLIDMVTTKPTLMLGLSAQDSNIQGIFAAAEQRMAWPYPSHPPAYVFSEDRLGFDQRGLLQNVYVGAFSAANRQAIVESALLRAYAKPLLTSLWLAVLCSKLAAVIDLATTDFPAAERDTLRAGLRSLRNLVAEAAPPDQHEAFLRAALPWVGRTMSLFQDGRLPATGSAPYRPLSVHPTHQMLADPATASSGVGGLAVASGLVGMGIDQGAWSAAASPASNPKTGALCLTSPTSRSEIFFAANAQSALRLFENGHVSPMDDAVLVHSEEIVPAMPRAPRPASGRTARPSLRQVSISSITKSAATSADLLQRFREEIVL